MDTESRIDSATIKWDNETNTLWMIAATHVIEGVYSNYCDWIGKFKVTDYANRKYEIAQIDPHEWLMADAALLSINGKFHVITGGHQLAYNDTKSKFEE